MLPSFQPPQYSSKHIKQLWALHHRKICTRNHNSIWSASIFFGAMSIDVWSTKRPAPVTHQQRQPWLMNGGNFQISTVLKMTRKLYRRKNWTKCGQFYRCQIWNSCKMEQWSKSDMKGQNMNQCCCFSQNDAWRLMHFVSKCVCMCECKCMCVCVSLCVICNLYLNGKSDPHLGKGTMYLFLDNEEISLTHTRCLFLFPLGYSLYAHLNVSVQYTDFLLFSCT